MTHFIMNDSDGVIAHNLEFKLRYPLYKTASAALDRFHDLQLFVDKLSKVEENRNTIFRCLNECDFILNTLEEF